MHCIFQIYTVSFFFFMMKKRRSEINLHGIGGTVLSILEPNYATNDSKSFKGQKGASASSMREL